jgi:hypothetical protein
VKKIKFPKVFISSELAFIILVFFISIPITLYYLWFWSESFEYSRFLFNIDVTPIILILGIFSISGPAYLLVSIFSLFQNALGSGHGICFVKRDGQVIFLIQKKFRIKKYIIRMEMIDSLNYDGSYTTVWFGNMPTDIIFPGHMIGLGKLVFESRSR